MRHFWPLPAYWRWLGIGLVPVLFAMLLLPLRSYVSPTDIAMLQLLWISVMALQYGASAALLTTLCSILLLNWCFVRPYYTLHVHDVANLITFVVMSAIGLFISYLATRLRAQWEKRRQLNALLRGLYRLASGLNRQVDWPAQCAFASRLLSRRLQTPVQCLPLAAPSDVSCVAEGQQQWLVGDPAVAVVTCAQLPNRTQQHLLQAAVDLLWRQWQVQQLQLQNARQRLTVEREQHKAALLRSLSHDLRTPLATVLGASSMLADPTLQLSAQQRQQQAANIYQQSQILNNHFEKVLELSKAQLSSDALQLSTFNAADLVAGALARRSELAAAISQSLQIEPADLTAVELCGDADLLEIALANLLENCLHHGQPPFYFSCVAHGPQPILESPWQGQFALSLRHAVQPLPTQRRDGGHGLGLQICQTVAALHQGHCALSVSAGIATVQLIWSADCSIHRAKSEP